MNATLNDSLDDIFPASETPVSAPRALPQGNEWDRIRALDGQVPVAKPFVEKCPKCRGRGRFISYSGRDCGPCFTCKGKGEKEFKTAPTVRAAARERAAAQPANRWEAFKAAHPAEAAFIDLKTNDPRCPEGYREILTSFRGAIGKYGELTGKQMAVVQQGVEREKEFAARRAAGAQQSNSRSEMVDASKIVEAIQKGRAAGLKWVCLRFNGLVIYEAKKHPGTLYVKTGKGEDGLYLGKIAEGRFFPSRECDDVMKAKIILVASDPAAAAKVYGLETGSCCCCGRELTDKTSIAMGIGPICAEKFGF